MNQKSCVAEHVYFRILLRQHKRLYSFVLVVAMLMLSACSSTSKRPFSPKRAQNINDGCMILSNHQTWRDAFDDAYKTYGVPPHVVMAIIHQESRFVHDARPPRKVVMGVPTVRPSTAYGYAQALDVTWDWYKKKTGNGPARRDNFPDAVDFIGWYVLENHKRTGVSKWDAAQQYLAYHDGTGGYIEGTHKQKPWLLKVAQKVAKRSKIYRKHLGSCYVYPQLQ